MMANYYHRLRLTIYDRWGGLGVAEYRIRRKQRKKLVRAAQKVTAADKKLKRRQFALKNRKRSPDKCST